MAKAEAGQLTISPTRVEPAPLVVEAVDLHRAIAEEKGIEIGTRVSDRLLPIRADRDRIVQAFANLIGNAIKSSPPWEGGSRSAPNARATRSDSRSRTPGRGSRKRISRTSSMLSGRRGEGGRGGGPASGLPIAKGIIEIHGGRIWSRASWGRGLPSPSRFRSPTGSKRWSRQVEGTAIGRRSERRQRWSGIGYGFLLSGNPGLGRL